MAKLRIDTKLIIDNLQIINKLCKKRECELIPVTKVCLSSPVIISSFTQEGISTIADSNIRNFEKLDSNIKKFLLKIRLSDMNNNTPKCDFFYTSSIDILEKLSKTGNYDKKEVFIALELGDLREGVPAAELPEFVEKVLKLPGISIKGLAANFGCLMGRIPDQSTADLLTKTLNIVKDKTGFVFEKISFGGTAVYPALLNGTLPKEVNQVRIGEAIFFGYNLTVNKEIPGLKTGTFILSGEILEIWDKKVDLPGLFVLNAFGEKSINEETGVRKRAVIDFGELGASIKGMEPVDSTIKITGATHDYTIADITDSEKKYKIGNFIDFILTYNSAAQAFISHQVDSYFV